MAVTVAVAAAAQRQPPDNSSDRNIAAERTAAAAAAAPGCRSSLAGSAGAKTSPSVLTKSGNTEKRNK